MPRPPADLITEATMDQVFDLPCTVIADPVHGTPHVSPA